jgi:hypothetical protein
MMNDKWSKVLQRATEAGPGSIEKRMVDAEMRITRGVALRQFYFASREAGAVDKTLGVNLSDEMAVLTRITIRKHIEWMARQGVETTEAAECRYGWNVLREIVRTGVVENATSKGLRSWGHVRMTVARMYDDLILRHHWPRQDSGEPTFHLNGFVPPGEPVDAYLTTIQPDGQTFTFEPIKPGRPADHDQRVIVEEGQHRNVAIGRLLH